MGQERDRKEHARCQKYRRNHEDRSEHRSYDQWGMSLAVG